MFSKLMEYAFHISGDSKKSRHTVCFYCFCKFTFYQLWEFWPVQGKCGVLITEEKPSQIRIKDTEKAHFPN